MIERGSVVVTVFPALLAVFLCGCETGMERRTAPAPSPEGTLTVYVATNGNDAWSGRRAGPNFFKTDGPLATLEYARDEARRQRGTMAARIVVRGGVYCLPRPLLLEPPDSGLTIEGAPDEEVVVSGGCVVRGWKP